MTIIAALSTDHLIGSGDGMPWEVPEEYQQFLDFIAGQTVIMGRRSFEIFGGDLTSAHALVVSRSASDLEGAIVCRSLDEACAQAAAFGKTVFSAGGATIYEQTLPRADRMYLSYIKGDFEGDTYFPAFDEAEWQVVRREEHPRFVFVAYARRAG